MFTLIDAAGCTNCCRHCSAEGHPPYGAFFSLAEMVELVAEGWEIYPYYEASAHPEFPAILGPPICAETEEYVPTNGFGIARAPDPGAVLRQLRDYGRRFLSLTLHGTAEHHDWFVGRHGAYADIIEASRLGREHGFGIHWNLYLDNRNLEEIPEVIAVGREATAGEPWLEIVANRGNRRTWRYEALRPSLRDVRERLAPWVMQEAWKAVDKQPVQPEKLTEAYWLAEWQRLANAGESLEPFMGSSAFLKITRDREVYLMAPPPVRLLGHLSEGREALEARAEELAATPAHLTPPPEADTLFADSDLLHPYGASVRQKLIGILQFGPCSEGAI
ncbi:radical SAM protein [bacterium]|nr:radical SAM protein [bacterium]